MSAPLRIILLLAAILVYSFIAVVGIGLANAFEPEKYRAVTVSWLILGVLFSAPLWLPAVIPNRFPIALALCRRVSAAFLCIPTYLFSSNIVHNVTRIFSGLVF
jgi:hypothetical protein